MLDKKITVHRNPALRYFILTCFQDKAVKNYVRENYLIASLLRHRHRLLSSLVRWCLVRQVRTTEFQCIAVCFGFVFFRLDLLTYDLKKCVWFITWWHFFLVVECKIHCQNGGTCVAPYKCSCQRGYGGTLCEKGEFLHIDNGERTAEDYNT